MDPLHELLAAIARDHADHSTQLVLADHLMAEGDPRGELIVLDHLDRTTPGGLEDRDGLERLLLLAAEYTFPDPSDSVPPLLPWEGGGSHPVQYEVRHGGHYYYLRYRNGGFSIEIDDEVWEGFPDRVTRALVGDNTWERDETELILRVIGDAIQAGSPFPDLVFPFEREPLPAYPGGPIRCYRLPAAFREPRGIPDSRYGLAARDYQRWHVLWGRLQRLA